MSIYFILDSTVLAYVMKLLNDRYDYGLKLVLLSIDEGITGYRDDSLEVFIKFLVHMQQRVIKLGTEYSARYHNTNCFRIYIF